MSASDASDRCGYQVVEWEAAGSTLPIGDSSTSDEVVIQKRPVGDRSD